MPNAPGEGLPDRGAVTAHTAGRRTRRRGVAGAAALLVTAGTLAACGSGGGGANTLTWYINPDSGGQAEIASRCTDAADGAYTIKTAQLPRESAQQREQLVRRLAAQDSSIDIVSLDPPYIPEFAEAGFRARQPSPARPAITDGVVTSRGVLGSTVEK